MRVAAVLASLAIAAIHPALAADPPGASATPGSDTPSAVRSPVAAPAAEAPPATATSASSAAPTTPAASAAQADTDAAQLERRMHARGYTTRLENGEKVFCRRESVLGSRLGGAMHCMHADEARANLIQNDEEQLRLRMMMGCVPSHNSNGQPVANCGN